MELWRVPAASTFISFPMVDVTGLQAAGLSNIIGKWFAWGDTTGPPGASVLTTLTGAISEVGGVAKTSIYSLALASTELPTASPYVMCQFTSTSTPNGNAVATQYVLIRTASQYANVIAWGNGMVPATSVTGVPKVDVQDLLGTVVATPATAGILDVNVKNIANSAVSTSTAQLGVNAVNWAGGAIPAPNVTGTPKVDVLDVNGTAINNLISGRIDANTQAMASGVITNTTFAAGAIDSTALSLSGASLYADSILGRNLKRGSSGGRTVSQALMALRDKVTVTSGTLSVYDTTDAAVEWTLPIATVSLSAMVNQIG